MSTFCHARDAASMLCSTRVRKGKPWPPQMMEKPPDHAVDEDMARQESEILGQLVDMTPRNPQSEPVERDSFMDLLPGTSKKHTVQQRH